MWPAMQHTLSCYHEPHGVARASHYFRLMGEAGPIGLINGRRTKTGETVFFWINILRKQEQVFEDY